MRLITFLFLFAILSPLRSAELVESWATLNFQYAPRNAASKSTITVSSGSLIAQLGLSGGGVICVGDAQDRMADWSFKHRAYAPIAGVAPTETDLSGILKMEVLGYSEVGTAKSPSSTAPKRPLRLGWVTSSRTVKVTFRPSVDCESELWGVMVVNYNVTQYPGSLEASWVPSSVSLKLGGVWTPGDGGQAGSATMLLTMGSFKKVASDSVQSSVSQLKVAGQSATLKANITGPGSLSYQWFKDGVAVVGGTSSTLIIPSLGLVHAGSYRVEVRDGYGTSQSSFMTLALLEFKQQPQGASVVVGAPITLSAQAQGGESPVSYQWYKGAQLVTGATSSNLSIGSATLANAGTYSVKASAGGATLTSNSVQVSVIQVPLEMVLVTGGTLPASSDLGAVTVQTFYIGKTEVTWGEWKTVRTWAVANGYTDLASGKGQGDNYPVSDVNWYDVVKWCNARSEKEGKTPVYLVNGAVYKIGQVTPTEVASANGYRLPSEKEWEFAARGGVQTQGYTYSGSNDLNAVGWSGGNSGGAVKEVGKKQANELGIYDMSGNLWEWSGSWYPGSEGSSRVIRGGGWFSGAGYCSVASRYYFLPGNRDSYDARYGNGFRVALSSVP